MRRIAIIDDNEDCRLLFAAMLEEHYETVCHESGPAALAAMSHAVAVDLVLLDISMPGLDGLQVLERLRQLPAYTGVPVIALTAHAMLGDAERFINAGFNGYLAKPIVEDDLLLAPIRRLLGDS